MNNVNGIYNYFLGDANSTQGLESNSPKNDGNSQTDRTKAISKEQWSCSEIVTGPARACLNFASENWEKLALPTKFYNLVLSISEIWTLMVARLVPQCLSKIFAGSLQDKNWKLDEGDQICLDMITANPMFRFGSVFSSNFRNACAAMRAGAPRSFVQVHNGGQGTYMPHSNNAVDFFKACCDKNGVVHRLLQAYLEKPNKIFVDQNNGERKMTGQQVGQALASLLSKIEGKIA